MKSRAILILGTHLLFSSCAPTSPPTSSPHGGGHGQALQQNRQLTLQDQSTEEEVTFTVFENGQAFTDYGISHTKEMHLIVVRDDLLHFSHLHPERNNGTWKVAFAPEAGGNYWLYADFVEGDATPHTLQFIRVYAGDLGETGVVKDASREKVVADHRFRLDVKQESDKVTFTYTIEELNGHPVTTLQDYLGAKGHSVLISSKGDFVHTHPVSEGSGPTVIFKTAVPDDDFYRIFTQFQIEGEVVTVSFDWEK